METEPELKLTIEGRGQEQQKHGFGRKYLKGDGLPSLVDSMAASMNQLLSSLRTRKSKKPGL